METVPGALQRVLKYSADGYKGVFWQLQNHTAHLITQIKLQSVSRVPGTYGAPEVQLILNDIYKRLPPGQPAEPLLQKIALVQTCFMTGIRIGSLVAMDKLDKERRGMRQEDVSFITQEHGAWTLLLRIKYLKGYNLAEDSQLVKVRMHPLKEAKSIRLEPIVVFLVILINQGALRANGPDGLVINSVDQLLA